jgi:hypothetical protein
LRVVEAGAVVAIRRRVRSLLVVLLLVCLASSRANAGDGRTPSAVALDRTAQLVEVGRISEAMRDLAVLVEQFAEDPEMHATYAVLLEAHGRLPEAIARQQRAVALAPGKPEYRRGLARLLIAGGELDGALAALVAAQAIDGFPGERRDLEQRLAIERQPIPAEPADGARRAAFQSIRGGATGGLGLVLERARLSGGEQVGWSLDEEVVDGDDVLVGVHFLFRRVYDQARLERDALLVGKRESELNGLTSLVLAPLSRRERERVLSGRLGQKQSSLVHATLRYRRADLRLLAVTGAEGEIWRAPPERVEARKPPASSVSWLLAGLVGVLFAGGALVAFLFRFFDRLSTES